MPTKRETLQGEVRANKTHRHFHMTAYTGVAIDRPYGRLVIDVAGIVVPSRLPILLNHDPERVVGFADQNKREKGSLELSGPLVSTPEGDRVATLSDEDYPWTASVGVETDDDGVEDVEEGRTVAVNGSEFVGPFTLWRRSRLFETSFVTVGPADRNTSAEVLAERGREEVDAKALAEAAKKIKEDCLAELAAFEAAFSDRPGFGARAYLAGRTLEQARAEEAGVLRKEKAEVEGRLEVAEKAREAAEKAREAAERTREAARFPGAGFPGAGFPGTVFTGPAPAASLDGASPEVRAKHEWDTSEAVRETFSSERALAAWYRREAKGLRGADRALEQAAQAIVRNSMEA